MTMILEGEFLTVSTRSELRQEAKKYCGDISGP